MLNVPTAMRRAREMLESQQHEEAERVRGLSFRQVGKTKAGKLRRGPAGAASAARTVASIPSKQEQQLATKTQRLASAGESEGFSSTSARFPPPNGALSEDVPGPGQYSLEGAVSHTHCAPVENPSYSKRGLGGFASRDRRFDTLFKPVRLPGPGTYTSEAAAQGKQKSANVYGSAAFVEKLYPEAEHILHNEVPGPGYYETEGTILKPAKVVVGRDGRAKEAAPFTSKDERFNPALMGSMSTHSDAPGPGAYEAAVPAHKDGGSGSNTSVFRESGKRYTIEGHEGPGPGSYEIVSPTTAHTHAKKHTQNKSPPSLLPKKIVKRVRPKSTPGPGTYNIAHAAAHTQLLATSSSTAHKAADEHDPGKPVPTVVPDPRRIATGPTQSSAFKSGTGRTVAAPNFYPGPAYYSPADSVDAVRAKRSFHTSDKEHSWF